MQCLAQCMYRQHLCKSVVYYGLCKHLEFELLVVKYISMFSVNWITLDSCNAILCGTTYIGYPNDVIGGLVIQPILLER